jgi:hypothetical protein
VPSGGAGTRKRSESLNGSGGTSVRTIRKCHRYLLCVRVTLQPEFDECLSMNNRGL